MTRPILFYDDGCRFCRASAQAIYRLDRRSKLALLRFSDPRFETCVAHLPEDQRLIQSHVAFPDGSVLSGGDAMLHALGVIPVIGVVFRLALKLGATRVVAGAVYRFVAKHRWRVARFTPDVPGPLVEP